MIANIRRAIQFTVLVEILTLGNFITVQINLPKSIVDINRATTTTSVAGEETFGAEDVALQETVCK